MSRAAAVAAIVLALASCKGEEAEAPPPIRIVRTVTVEPPAQATEVRFTGHIEAEDRAALSFRIGGRVAERRADLGQSVGEGQVVARLDPENELNDLRSAQAALAAAQGNLRKAQNHFQRQRHLVERHVISQAEFESAEQGLRSARAAVAAAQARVDTAQEVVGFTTLKADAPGVVTRVGAEPGEVVAAGRMIVELARREGRDAVFEVPADLVRRVTTGLEVRVALAADSATTAFGRVREIAPQADPVTRTFSVRVGLTDPPAAFRLGAAVSGAAGGGSSGAIAIPATAIVQGADGPGAWVVDPKALTVSRRKLDLLDSNPATALVSKGLSAGDIVVTAGAGQLHEGQRVRLIGAEAP
ncbi:efflux RND transporter periplasmic adaptor subunit [Enterovirga sp.]|uniref:efflux RND transporter periplasmic adaptor subunit n=1 Tax=Enterovirga sp. TaxID=2026350 RepID=UPI002CDA25CE|nr:efflux RND transporter periplasmic adaptor subunit [Enterovirga sp.]HMO30161.1 efflux RND transporter periplasmic adaptor subunit [Enterovirga sp.]